ERLRATDVGPKIHPHKTRNEPSGLVQESEIAVLHGYSSHFRSDGQFWFAPERFILNSHFWRRWNGRWFGHSGGCVRLNESYSCFALRDHRSPICRNGFCARCWRIRQTPFSFCVLWPHNFGSNERNFLDHQPARKERKETNAQPECSSLQEIFRPDRYGLRNRYAAKFKSAPGSDAHAANFERNAETASQFLLNLSLCPLGLHIQVHAEQNHCTESNQCPQSDHCQP